MLLAAGFVDIQQVSIKVPINTWHTDPFMKECGKWFGTGLMEGLEAMSLGPFTRVLGWTPEEVKNFLGPVKRDIQNKNIHAYNLVYVLYTTPLFLMLLLTIFFPDTSGFRAVNNHSIILLFFALDLQTQPQLLFTDILLNNSWNSAKKKKKNNELWMRGTWTFKPV